MSELNSPPPARVTPPPLSIRQVMLWTAITAAIMGLVRFFDGPDTYPTRPKFIVISEVGYAIFWGPGVGALLSWPFWRRRGHVFPVYGGDWLLLVVGISAALMIVPTLILEPFDWLLSDQDGLRGLRILMLIGAVANAIVLVAYVAATVCVKATAWRVTLGLLAAAQLLGTAAAIQQVAYALCNEFGLYTLPFAREGWLWTSWENVQTFDGVCLTVPVILVGAWDVIRRRSLPWTHWLGMIAWLMSHAVAFSQYVFIKHFSTGGFALLIRWPGV